MLFSTHWVVACALLWIAGSFGVVSFAYLANAPWVFRKKESGRVPLIIKLILLPFLLSAQAYNFWSRKRDTVPSIQKIDEHLFLACRLFPSDIEVLESNNIEAILDATSEFDGLGVLSESYDFDYLNIPILDHRSPTPEDVKRSVKWIHSHIQNSQSVVVHCALGRGRSVFLVAAYLLARYPAKTVREVLVEVNAIRGTARLNKTQIKTLIRLHEDKAFIANPHALLVVNPVSGGGKWQLHQDVIKEQLSRQYELTIVETHPDEELRSNITELITNDTRCIIAGGGDGTLREAAQIAIEKNVDFGIIPLGTTNALAHALYGNLSKIMGVTMACDIITQGTVKKMDVSWCNDEVCLLTIGVGFEAQMIIKADRAKKNESGQMAYLQGMSEAVIENQIQILDLSIDNDKWAETEVSSLVVANAAPFTTILAQGNGEPDPFDGKLDITLFKKLDSPMTLLNALFSPNDDAQAQTSEATADKVLKTCQAEKIQLQSASRFDYVIDGEVRSAQQLDIFIQKQALNVFINA